MEKGTLAELSKELPHLPHMAYSMLVAYLEQRTKEIEIENKKVKPNPPTRSQQERIDIARELMKKALE